MSEIKLEKITIKIDEKQERIVLSPEQAKKLKNILNELFADPVYPQVIPYPVYQYVYKDLGQWSYTYTGGTTSDVTANITIT